MARVFLPRVNLSTTNLPRCVALQQWVNPRKSNVSAVSWPRLRKPLASLGHETPLEVAQTESGARVVETLLGKMAWGAAA